MDNFCWDVAKVGSKAKSNIFLLGSCLSKTILKSFACKHNFCWGLASVNTYAKVNICYKTYVCSRVRDISRLFISSFLAGGRAGQGLRNMTLCADRACRVLKREAKCEFAFGCRRKRRRRQPCVQLSSKTEVEVDKACNCRQKRRWRLPKCVTVVEKAAKVEVDRVRNC